jgi:DNA modification methylase
MNKIINADVIEGLRQFPDGIASCCVTSPPYFGLRDYGVDGQIGIEETPEDYVQKMVEVFREVRRVLRDDGTVWLNIGDSYFSDTRGSGGPSEKQESNAGTRFEVKKFKRTNGIKPKDLIGIPWMLAFALRADGWYLRQDIIWNKKNGMPEPVIDRCVKSHEYVFLLSKNSKYYYDNEAIKEPIAKATLVRAKSSNNADKRKDNGVADNQCGLTPDQQNKYYENLDENSTRNKRSVWTIATKSFSGAHFATFNPDLITPMILAGSPKGGIVLDPFMGSGTTAGVAAKLGRQYIGTELNPDYCKFHKQRIKEIINEDNELKTLDKTTQTFVL